MLKKIEKNTLHVMRVKLTLCDCGTTIVCSLWHFMTFCFVQTFIFRGVWVRKCRVNRTQEDSLGWYNMQISYYCSSSWKYQTCNIVWDLKCFFYGGYLYKEYHYWFKSIWSWNKKVSLMYESSVCWKHVIKRTQKRTIYMICAEPVFHHFQPGSAMVS